MSGAIARSALAVLMLICIALFPGNSAAEKYIIDVDRDHDGLIDTEEKQRYRTDPGNRDTDHDGYGDGEEIANGYSPLHPKKKKLTAIDTDDDGLADAFEFAFGSDSFKKDTDNDGYHDRDELWSGYDPRTSQPKKIRKKIVVTLATQRLGYYANDIRIEEVSISSGKWNWPTPKGEFVIGNKMARAWSKLAGLWMPYWLGLKGEGFPTGRFGIHELPEWPNGYKEGENHLGKPVSHGCIRLGVRNAKKVYDWTPLGTTVIIR